MRLHGRTISKWDERFYDDTLPDAKAASATPPFPDMKRHTNWRYVNPYFSLDETPLPDTRRSTLEPSSNA